MDMGDTTHIGGPLDKPPTLSDLKIELRKPVATAAEKPDTDERVSTRPAVSGPADKTSWQSSSEVQELIKSLSGENSSVSIGVDPETHKIVVEVVDRKTGAVIRKIPPEDFNRLTSGLKKVNGLSLDTMA